MLQKTIGDDQKFVAHVNPKSHAGNPANVEPGSVHWSLPGGADKVTINPSPDGLSCEIISVTGATGDGTVLVEADADLGAGVETISDTIVVTVQPAKAENLGLSADEAVQK